MSALQRRPAILVAPVVFAVQTVVPVLLAPFVVHASFLDSPLSGVPLLGCLLVLLGGRDGDRALAGAAGDQRRPRSALEHARAARPASESE